MVSLIVGGVFGPAPIFGAVATVPDMGSVAASVGKPSPTMPAAWRRLLRERAHDGVAHAGAGALGLDGDFRVLARPVIDPGFSR